MIEDNSKTFVKDSSLGKAENEELSEFICPNVIVPKLDETAVKTILKLRGYFNTNCEPRPFEINRLDSLQEKAELNYKANKMTIDFILKYFECFYKEMNQHKFDLPEWRGSFWLKNNTIVPHFDELEEALKRKDAWMNPMSDTAVKLPWE